MAASSSPSSSGGIIRYFRDFKILAENPREYWGIQLINFLDSAAYFAMLGILTLFLKVDMGLGVRNTGYVMTAFTSLITISLLFSGLAGDVLGIRKSIYISLSMKLLITLGIGGIALGRPFHGRAWVVAALLVLMAPFLAMIQTAFQSANVRFTTKRSRSAGFNLWYLFMNVGAAVGGYLIDLVHLTLKLHWTWVMMVPVVTSSLGLVAGVLMVRGETQAIGPDEAKSLAGDAAVDEAVMAKKGVVQIVREMLSQSAFWRFLAVVFLLLGVRAVFVYMYLLMPHYWIEVLGANPKIGMLNMINPILIVAGLILFIPIANKFNIFKMLTYGAIISSLSLFALLIPWRMLGSDFVKSYYTMSFICMVVLSIGEVIWSPKLQEYTAAIAPKGQEGSYLGMSMMPWFLAKTLVSAMSGSLLVRWVPEGIGERMRQGTVAFWDRPEAMWLILGLWALSGPVLAIIFQKWLTKGARWKSEEHLAQNV